MLLIGAALLVIVILQNYLGWLLIKYGYSFSSQEIEVDQNLPNFFEAVKLSDADWIVFEN